MALTRFSSSNTTQPEPAGFQNERWTTDVILGERALWRSFVLQPKIMVRSPRGKRVKCDKACIRRWIGVFHRDLTEVQNEPRALRFRESRLAPGTEKKTKSAPKGNRSQRTSYKLRCQSQQMKRWESREMMTCAKKSDSSGRMYATQNVISRMPDTAQGCCSIVQPLKRSRVTH